MKDLLKSWSDKDLKKKSRSFTRDQLMKFLKEAPNTPEWLQKKGVAIVATYGGLRISELVYLLDTDILDWNKLLIRICVRKSKTDKKGEGYQFIIERAPEGVDPNPYLILEQYIEKLEDDMVYAVGESNQRFWLRYDVKSGKFVNSPVGKNLLAKIPSEIAEFLGLPNPEEFTGHCFRHTFANILANSGCSKVQLMQAGRWKSGAACDGYLANSDVARTNVSSAITSGSFNPMAYKAVLQQPPEVVPEPMVTTQDEDDGMTIADLKKKMKKVKLLEDDDKKPAAPPAAPAAGAGQKPAAPPAAPAAGAGQIAIGSDKMAALMQLGATFHNCHFTFQK